MAQGKQATASDVAEYILSKHGPMSAMKLQKLVYYAQAWSLAWTELPLFDEDIQAWANGPVVPSLWQRHRGLYQVEQGRFKGDLRNICPEQGEVIDRVVDFYGDKSPQWLSDLTHMECPWQQARTGLPIDARGKSTISKESMLEYYSSLKPGSGEKRT